MDVMQAIKGRRAVRDFTERPVRREEILALVDAAISAPSAMDLQPWSFVVIEGRDRLRSMSTTAKRYLLSLPSTDVSHRPRLEEPSFNLFYDAPCLIVICARPPTRQATEDCCLAAQNLMLAAYSRGLGSCWIGFSRPWLELPQTRSSLGLLPDQMPVAPIIVGIPATVPPAKERHRPTILWAKPAE